MRLALVALLFVMFAPVTGAAQTVTVRSGEHDGFTRLVLDMPERVGWELTRAQGRTELRFERKGLSLDTSAVFQRIPRTRLTGVAASADGTALLLDLGCECSVTAFWHGESMLVLDVTGEGRPEQTQVASRAGPVSSIDSGQPARQQALPRLPLTSATSAALVLRGLGLATESPADPMQDMVEAQDAGKSRAAHDLVVLEETRDRLLQQFGRAASQGLLSPGTSMSGRSANASGPDDTENEPNEEHRNDNPAEAAPHNPRANIHLRAQSSIDRDFLAQLSGQTDMLEGTGCIEPRWIDVPGWAGTGPFHQQVGSLRAALTSEFDRTDETTALALARLYVHYGFGAEAHQVLSLVSAEGPEKQTLSALASIMEFGHAPAGSPLSGQLGCDTPAALWSLLSYENLPADVLLDEDAVLRAFASLPRHLRSYTGPILSRRYLEAGRSEESDRILRILDRHEETKSPDADLARAELELTQGETEIAEARLEEVVAANTEPSAEALALRIETLVHEGRDVSFDLAQLAGAYAHEYRDGPMGPVMAEAHVLALAASGAFDQAYRELDDLDIVHPDESGAIRARITQILAARAADPDFLRHALSGHTGAADDLPPETALEMARRLVDAGFPVRAIPFLDVRAEGSVAREMRLLRAEVSLELGRPRQAEVDLLGLSGADVNLLRARARSMVGEHGQAHELYRSAGLNAEAEREAWLAENWTDLSENASPERAAVAKLRLEAEDDAGQAGTLARNRGMLDEAGKTRAALEALLSASPLPADVEN